MATPNDQFAGGGETICFLSVRRAQTVRPSSLNSIADGNGLAISRPIAALIWLAVAGGARKLPGNRASILKP
jgi:hypothetical protein